MIINLLKNKSDPKKVYKNIETLRSGVDLQLFGDCSIENPVFLISTSNIVPDCNYIEVPAWGRKYFATVTIKDGDRAIISCKSDTLSNFFTACGNSPIIARRSSSRPDYRIEDNRVLKLKEPAILVKRVNASLPLSSNFNYVLTMTGK